MAGTSKGHGAGDGDAWPLWVLHEPRAVGLRACSPDQLHRQHPGTQEYGVSGPRPVS